MQVFCSVVSAEARDVVFDCTRASAAKHRVRTARAAALLQIGDAGETS